MVRTRAGTRTTTSTSVASDSTEICDPALRMVLRGTICTSSPLRLLRGKEDILKSLFGLVLEEYWASCLEDTAARHPRAWARVEKGGGNLYTLWASVRVQPSVRAVLELWEQSASIWPAHLDEDAMGEDREFEG